MDPQPSNLKTNLKPTDKALGPIPRGIEVLVKKAAVDPEFRRILLEKRAAAADEIGLKLEPAEVAMLNAVPAAQLESIIANTNVSEVTRSAFLGRAAAVMLAALTATTAAGCAGSRPDQPEQDSTPPEPPKEVHPKGGVRPDAPNGTGKTETDKPAQEEKTATPKPEANKPSNPDELRKRVADLAEKLTAPEYETRENATLALIELGKPALLFIEELKPDNTEAVTRLARVKRVLKGDDPEQETPDGRRRQSIAGLRL